jgi:hypothetical protein
MNDKPILDACCGSRMFWFDKENPNVEFCDNRKLSTTLCDGRSLDIRPDIVCDFTELPFDDGEFKLVVFDPPHLYRLGEKSWIAKKYGKLPQNWPPLIHDGFWECMRVLDTYGTLIFKWNETDIPVSEIIKVIQCKPMFGHKSGKLNNTHWMAFMKIPQEVT